MLNSAIKILNSFDINASLYNVHHIEMMRSENIEDRYYLCNVDKDWYVVYETDYVATLPVVVREITAMFASEDLKPLHWLVKKDAVEALGASTFPIDTRLDDTKQGKISNGLVLEHENSYLKQLVLKFQPTDTSTHYDPIAYGYKS